MFHTHPYIAYAVSVVSHFMHSPSDNDMDVVRILRYLKVAPGKGLVFSKHGHVDVKWYTNSYWTGLITDHHSTSRYFTFGGGNLVTWRSKKQKVEARLSAEAKIGGMSCRVYELLWLRNFVGRFWVQIRNGHEFPL